MKKFDKRFTKGTLVKVAGVDGFHEITEIQPCRKLINVAGLVGSFQRGHIVTFTNRGFAK